MTRVAVMQPYLFPALPYIQLASAVDLFVFYDDAAFSHGRWTHRNRVRVGGRPHLFTVPLSGRGPDRALGDIALDPRSYPHWRRKLMATLRQAYTRAPFAADLLPQLDALLARPRRTLAELAADSVRWLAARFRVEPRWSHSTAFPFDRAGAAQDKVLAMVRGAGGTAYVNTPGGRALYNAADFASAGVRLGFVENRAAAMDGDDLSALHLALCQPPDVLGRLAADHRVDWVAG